MSSFGDFLTIRKEGQKIIIGTLIGGEIDLRVPMRLDDFYTPRVIPVIFNIPGGVLAADYDGVPFIADKAYEVVAVRQRHLVAGSDAGAVTLMLKKVASGQAPSAGTDVLAAGINLKAVANTNQSPALHATQANRELAVGDGLALVPTGVLTAVDGVSLTAWLRALAAA